MNYSQAVGTVQVNEHLENCCEIYEIISHTFSKGKIKFACCSVAERDKGAHCEVTKPAAGHQLTGTADPARSALHTLGHQQRQQHRIALQQEIGESLQSEPNYSI